MHTKKHRGNKRKTQQHGCGMCGKKRCKKHGRQTMKGGCGSCMGGGQKAELVLPLDLLIMQLHLVLLCPTLFLIFFVEWPVFPQLLAFSLLAFYI